MDAYDAGGLTFEVASLFVGPAAVVKMAKGIKLGAKVAEMISLPKNSTKVRILTNVEKWGSKVDNILAKSNNVIRQFGEKLLDTRIPVGIRKEAVAFAGGMGTMPAFSVESKTLREVMHFSSKHADDVVRGVGGSGRAERVTQAVNNMSEFFETDFGKKIRDSLRKTKKQYDGQSVYEVTKDIDDILKKGDKLYLDGRHKDHFEVFNKRGKVKDVLNLDGTSNSKKFNLASGRRLK